MAGRPLCAADMPQTPSKTLTELFAAEPDRLSTLSFDIVGIYFDWSKTHLDKQFIERSLARAGKMGFAEARRALFDGEIVNPSEQRAATHVAERGSGAPAEVDLATARRQRMRALVDAIEAGAFGDVTGILHVGIGGSALGPPVLGGAPGRPRAQPRVRVFSHLHGGALSRAGEPPHP